MVRLDPRGQRLNSWRAVPAAMAVVTIAAITAVMLSDRAPLVLRRLSNRIDAGTSRAAEVASQASPQSDFDIHVLSWALAALFVGLAAWSWRSLVLGNGLLFLYTVAVELAQGVLATTRNVEVSDIVANGAGVAAGLGLATALSLVLRASRLPDWGAG